MTKSTTVPAEKFSSYHILLITLLALTQFTIILDFMVMNPLGDELKKSMELSPKQFGFVVAGYALSAGISGLLTAGFADRFDRKKLLLFFYIGFILGTLFCGLSTNYPLLLLSRVITGIFGGVIGGISMAIVTDIFPVSQRGRVMAFMQMGFGASQVLGIPISLYISNIWGWKAPFFMIVGLATIIWMIMVAKMQPVALHLENPNKTNALRHLWNTVRSRKYRIGFTATALLSLGGFMMMPWGSVFAINNLHVTKAQLPLLFMISGLATLFIMPVMGKLSDRFDKFRVFTFASILMIIVVTIYTNMTPVALWIIIAINILMMVGIMGRMVPSVAMTSSLPQMYDRGAFMSINSSLQQIAGGVAAIISGFIVHQKDEFSPLEHYNIMGYVVSAIVIFCIFMIYRVSKIVKAERNS